MTTQVKARPRAAAPGLFGTAQAGLWPKPPQTREEHLQCIESLGQRIAGHVGFMCRIAGLTGTSDEAKERAVTAFYERMVVVERQLGRIQEELLLE